MTAIKPRRHTRIQRRQRQTAGASPAIDTEPSDGDCVVIPPGATTLSGFRAWSASDTFPERGKITFVDGEIIIDTSPERIDSHGSVKTEVCRVIANVIFDEDLGKLFIERTRIVHVAAGISNEPEALFIRV
jgi:hypothetical protein